MSTDRELLDLAAKAAGLDYESFLGAVPEFNEYRVWNPLTDDGDALRLSVKLRIDLCQFDDASRAAYWDSDYEPAHIDFDHESDPYAATRRAITLAAAEIGRAML